jgi:hypothetical protein
MNERIKELILQSVTFRLDPDSECYEAQVCPEDLEYLAELIIKETLQVAKAGVEFGPSMEEAVYTYFGVKE